MCNLHLQGTGFLPKGPAFSWNGSGFQVSGGTSELLAAEAFSREEEARGGLGNTCGLCPAGGEGGSLSPSSTRAGQLCALARDQLRAAPDTTATGWMHSELQGMDASQCAPGRTLVPAGSRS